MQQVSGGRFIFTGMLSVLFGVLIGALPGSASEESLVRQTTRNAVQACAENTAPGTAIQVSEPWLSLCDKRYPDPYQHEHTDYSITRVEEVTANSVHQRILARISLDVPLKIKGSAKERHLLLERTQACVPLMNLYWNHYGIDLTLNLIPASENDPPTYNTIRITNDFGRSNSRELFFYGLGDDMKNPFGIVLKGGPHRACLSSCASFGFLRGITDCKQTCESLRQKQFCNTALHEFGHRLGLPDEYADPATCPDRESVSSEQNPWSIMATPQVAAFDQADLLGNKDWQVDSGYAEFFPRHVEKILAPLCPKR